MVLAQSLLWSLRMTRPEHGSHGALDRLAASLVASSLALATSPAQAIITRHDVADAEYVVADADYPALVDLFEPGDCLGSVVAPDALLTVAHCAVDLALGDPLVVAGELRHVVEVVLHPDWTDRDVDDIAIVRLDAPVTVAPLALYRGASEVGQPVTLLGRGVTATGLDGEPGADSDGQLRRATNVVSDATQELLEIRFAAPEDDDVTDFEGVGAAGDSGGPLFIRVAGATQIAGLNAFGEGNGVAIGQYGSSDYQTRVGSYLPWIEGLVELPEPPASPPGDATQPTPLGCSMRPARDAGAGAGWLLLLVVAGVTGTRRCRARRGS